MFYDGNPEYEPGAVVCRVAPSFIRLGNFELFAARDELDVLKRLADHTIQTHFPEICSEGNTPKKEDYLKWFSEVCRRTAIMVAHWMRVGFVHGVMNTDNLSILGLTIDYGPYGWLEDFDPDWTPNTTDAGGRRYRYSHQPQVALWNLAQLGNALYPLIGETEPLEEALSVFNETYETAWQKMLSHKLGLASFQKEKDTELVSGLFQTLQLTETDMTLFFRNLAEISEAGAAQMSDEKLIEPLREAYYRPNEMKKNQTLIASWVRRYVHRLEDNPLSNDERVQTMNATNPLYVMRNYLAQLAIDAATNDDFSLVQETLEVMRRPYEKQSTKGKFAEKRPEWARNRAGCSTLSCSS
jgi:serine/tyrosine/threonine adenylyltransferase